MNWCLKKKMCNSFPSNSKHIFMKPQAQTLFHHFWHFCLEALILFGKIKTGIYNRVNSSWKWIAFSSFLAEESLHSKIRIWAYIWTHLSNIRRPQKSSIWNTESIFIQMCALSRMFGLFTSFHHFDEIKCMSKNLKCLSYSQCKPINIPLIDFL